MGSPSGDRFDADHGSTESWRLSESEPCLLGGPFGYLDGTSADPLCGRQGQGPAARGQPVRRLLDRVPWHRVPRRRRCGPLRAVLPLHLEELDRAGGRRPGDLQGESERVGVDPRQLSQWRRRQRGRHGRGASRPSEAQPDRGRRGLVRLREGWIGGCDRHLESVHPLRYRRLLRRAGNRLPVHGTTVAPLRSGRSGDPRQHRDRDRGRRLRSPGRLRRAGRRQRRPQGGAAITRARGGLRQPILRRTTR